MKEPQIDCRVSTMTKTDQIALLRSIEMMVELLPKDTQARLLWEMHATMECNLKNSAVPQWGLRSALYGVRRAVEDAPSYMTAAPASA